MAGESAEQFAARRVRWYEDHDERRRLEMLPERTALEERLWARAERVVLARVVKVRSIRLRGSEGQWFRSPLATLRPIRWLRGRGAARRLWVHDLSDDSCDGGAGLAPDGEVGEHFLIFYGPGPAEPRNVLDSFSLARAVTSRTREAFAAAQRRGARPSSPKK